MIKNKVVLLFLIALMSLSAKSQFVTVNGSIDVEYTDSVSHSLVHVYNYVIPYEEANFIVHTNVSSNDSSNEVLIYANYPNYSESWSIPIKIHEHIGLIQSRFFCKDLFTHQSTEPFNFSIRIQSFSPQPRQYSLKVEGAQSNILQLNRKSTTTITSCVLKYLIHEIPESVEVVEIHLSSLSDQCTLVRFVNYSCPPDYTIRSSIDSDGLELTLLKRAHLRVRRSEFKDGRMMILLIPVPAILCGSKTEFVGDKKSEHYSKNITVIVKPGNTEFWSPILIMTIIFIIPYIMFAILIGFETMIIYFTPQHSPNYATFSHYKSIDIQDSDVKSKTDQPIPKKSSDSGEGEEENKPIGDSEGNDKTDVDFEIKDTVSEGDKDGQSEQSEQNEQNEQKEQKKQSDQTEQNELKEENEGASDIKPDSPKKIEKINFETLKREMLSGNAIKNLKIQYYNKILNDKEANISDVNLKPEKELNQIAAMYILLVFIVGVFFMLPAVQVSFSHQKMLRDTGVQDMCYFNFECDREAGPLRAFNNIWSNISYILLSILFVVITRFKHHTYIKQVKAEGQPTTGIPQRFGLYYAMALALFFEGIMSAIYHLCPSLNNYQFDTTFMYILLSMLSIRLYKMRHPDMRINPAYVFVFLSMAVFFTFVSLSDDGDLDPFSKTALTIILVLMTVYTNISAHTYVLPELGWYWFNEWRENRTSTYETFRIFFWPKHNKSRIYEIIIQLTSLIIVSIILWAPGMLSTIAAAVLYFFALNLLLYVGNYWILKFSKKEYQHRPWVFFLSFGILVISLVFWVIAFYFWSLTAIHWEVSPAAARNFNDGCVFLDYYDYHDLWHVMSAYAIFTIYLSTLIIDDNLSFKPRDQIAVI